MRRVATLSDSIFDISRTPLWVDRDRAGNFWVGGARGNIGLFDKGGKFIRVIAKSGSGPGEFRVPMRMTLGVKDSVFVYDFALRRMTVFSPTTRHYVRDFPVPAHKDALILNDGRLMVSGYIATGANAGLLLHIINNNGTIAKSWGVDTAIVRANADRWLSRALVRNPAGGFWVASTDKYEIELWDENYRRQRALIRNAAWFPPLAREKGIDFFARSPMPAQLYSIAIDDVSDLLITTTLLGTEPFKADPTLKGSSGEVALPQRDMSLYANEYIDTVIEFLDPRSAAIMATIRLKGVHANISHSPFFWTVRETKDGNIVVDILKAELKRPQA